MDAARFAQVLAYCRLDAEELSEADKVVLEGMIADAEAYMERGVGPKPGENTPRRAQYDQRVNEMVLDSWENRGTQAVGVTVMENPAFRRKLNQLKWP
ncbi:MAG: phage gp6-like head-tail connector protein [Oscillospiraceae bacterium]|nr:phage gp6-like head-tail connector protein [Oscillospiraceae bacterium]